MKLTHVEGAILVGGISTRMGRDKATLLYDGVPLALRVAAALGTCVERVRFVARPDELPELGLPCIVDRHAERAPLVGIAAALAACEASAVLVAACDLPEIDPRVLLARAVRVGICVRHGFDALPLTRAEIAARNPDAEALKLLAALDQAHFAGGELADDALVARVRAYLKL